MEATEGAGWSSSSSLLSLLSNITPRVPVAAPPFGLSSVVTFDYKTGGLLLDDTGLSILGWAGGWLTTGSGSFYFGGSFSTGLVLGGSSYLGSGGAGYFSGAASY